MHCTQTRKVFTSPEGIETLMVCRLGVKRRFVIPVILVPTPPKYFAFPRVSTWLPTEADFPQTSQALDMVHPKKLSYCSDLDIVTAQTNPVV